MGDVGCSFLITSYGETLGGTYHHNSRRLLLPFLELHLALQCVVNIENLLIGGEGPIVFEPRLKTKEII